MSVWNFEMFRGIMEVSTGKNLDYLQNLHFLEKEGIQKERCKIGSGTQNAANFLKRVAVIVCLK